MTRYFVVFEESPTGYGAYVLDLPGCVALGPTLEETRELIREAIELHIESMREAGEPIPPPSLVEALEVAGV
jgi:predicted RNase H-like HicB family nuclease